MASEVSVARARKWLYCNRLGGIEPSALLVARLAARRRGSWMNAVLMVPYFVASITWSVLDDQSEPSPGPGETDVSDLIGFMVTNLGLILAVLAGLWYTHRLERRLLATTTTRSAHPTAAGVTRVLGTRHLAAFLTVHGGGLLLGVAAALLAPRPDRALALTFLVSMAVLAAISGLALAGVLRRPSVAQDSESLLVDDVLRTQDARVAVMPFPLVVAGVAAWGENIAPWLIWALLGYFAVGAVAWLVAELSARRAPTGLAVAGR